MDRLALVNIGDVFNSPIGNTLGVGGLVSIVLSNALGIAGLIMLFFLVFGGISMIASAGQDNPERAAKGRQAVTAALIGFIIISISSRIFYIKIKNKLDDILNKIENLN